MSQLKGIDWAVERTGEKPEAIYRFCREGAFPHVRLGRKVKFDPAAVESFIASGGTRSPRSSDEAA